MVIYLLYILHYVLYHCVLYDHITDYSTALVGVKDSLIPCVRTQFMSRIDLRRAFKQLFRRISQLHLLATVVDE